MATVTDDMASTAASSCDGLISPLYYYAGIHGRAIGEAAGLLKT